MNAIIGRLERALADAAQALKEYKETQAMLTIERPVEIEVLGQTSSPDVEAIRRLYAEYWEILEPKGLIGLANELVGWELSAENLIALFMLGVSGGITERTWQAEWKEATKALAFPACLAPDFYQVTTEEPVVPKETEGGAKIKVRAMKEKDLKGLFIVYSTTKQSLLAVSDRLTPQEQLKAIEALEEISLDQIPPPPGMVMAIYLYADTYGIKHISEEALKKAED